mgnify:CR=1 FL=1
MLALVATVASIVVVNLVLSGDNALVIAMACRHLPLAQQKSAVFWGTLGAIALRVALTVCVAYLLKIPLLQVAGGLVLILIAVKLLKDEPQETRDCKAAESFGEAIRTIILADAVMSLDNVLAVAAAARSNIWLLIFGLALSIPIVIAGSRFILLLMQKVPSLVNIGAGILGWTAAEMIMEDRHVHSLLQGVPGPAVKLFPLALAALTILLGQVMARRQEAANKNRPDKPQR